ncbi:dCTP deaminase [Abditibacterium utsteinense]|uniref:dCTP deaminase n=1 Tax=Abditibacterium utsteinense TaxID=1960156 RepID=A0A2S8SQR5_9BACT|nr:dCTP deaminase [Abditibacterium utsteinense]PQV63125.1 dCTP deaminase [Abditibacterium utsteinense]
MVLSDVDLLSALESGKIRISPAPDLESQLGACSLDLRLGNEFRVFERARTAFIDPRNGINWDEFTRVVDVPDGEQFIMHPQELVLAATVEEISLPADMLGRLEGRSSLGRLGIIVHGTAPMFFPGFVGRCVMELGNIGPMPVALYPGMRICSMTFETISSASSRPYKGKYAGQQGPVGSKLQGDTEMKN